jgi:5-methylcytosine-specific restriction enzyme A
MEQRNYGILTSISWNSNNWTAPAIDEDIRRSNYEWVKENHRMMEDLNFAYDLYPPESDGTFVAYTPMLDRLPAHEASKYVEIVFFKSLNYHINENYIVGFYAFPVLGRFVRKANHSIYPKYIDLGNSGNVRSKPEHIVSFQNPILISNAIVESGQYLPTGKKLGQQGFNYLHDDNVMNILEKAVTLNPFDTKLKTIKFLISYRMQMDR